MKALEILKDMLEEVHTDEQGYSYKDEVILKAIAELEALQVPKTCYGCKWYRDFEAVCVNGDCPLCADFVSPNFGCVHFEPKDKE